MSEPLRVLVVDDDLDARVLVGRVLRNAFPETEIVEIGSAEELRRWLEHDQFDAVVTDYQLGWSDGLVVLREVRERFPACPVVMFTASGNEEVAVEAMKTGLDDYVLKSGTRYRQLAPAVRGAIERRSACREREVAGAEFLAREQAERRAAEAGRRRFMFLAQASAVFSASLDLDTILERLVELAVPYLADACAVDLLDAQVRRPRVTSTRPNLELSTDRDEEALCDTGGSSLAVPMAARGRLLGALTLHRRAVREPFEVADLDFLNDFGARAAMAVENALLYQETQEAQQRLARQLRFTAALTDNLGEGVYAVDRDGRITFVNPAAERIFRWSEAELLGRESRATFCLRGAGGEPTPEARVLEPPHSATNVVQVDEQRFTRRDGTPMTVSFSASPIVVDGEVVGAVVSFRDVSQRRMLEEQLRQSQKMEAIGTLAGGVAHDFNNMLAVINGYADLLLGQTPKGHPIHPALEEIRHAGQRAAGLTRQLLAFSRRQSVVPQVFDLNTVVVNMDRMLRRLIGEDIDLISRTMRSPARIKADPGQIEQVLMNLAINARDAMPRGGRLAVETGIVPRLELAADPVERPTGEYVQLTVSDSGAGMDAETLQHIFEPFFTTKEQGKGTGLGLSTVYGIVKQCGGQILVDSSLGTGTTFRIYLPRVDDRGAAKWADEVLGGLSGGRETVLVVEDEPLLRALMRDVLRVSGYVVQEAASAEEAVRLMDEHVGPLHLLLTDVVMPGMSGTELAEQFRASRPGSRVILTSGYSREAIESRGELPTGDGFLQKPFTPATLTRMVRDVLDAA